MNFFDYLMAAPAWHWVCFVLISALLSQWRPFHLKKTTETHTHDHKHVHTGTGKD